MRTTTLSHRVGSAVPPLEMCIKRPEGLSGSASNRVPAHANVPLGHEVETARDLGDVRQVRPSEACVHELEWANRCGRREVTNADRKPANEAAGR